MVKHSVKVIVDSVEIAVHIVNMTAMRYSASEWLLTERFVVVDVSSNAHAVYDAPVVFSGQHSTLTTP